MPSLRAEIAYVDNHRLMVTGSIFSYLFFIFLIPKPQRMIAVASLVIVETSTTLHAEAALGDHLLQQNSRPLGQAGPVLGIIVFDA